MLAYAFIYSPDAAFSAEYLLGDGVVAAVSTDEAAKLLFSSLIQNSTQDKLIYFTGQHYFDQTNRRHHENDARGRRPAQGGWVSKVQAIHPIRHTADGAALCRWCSTPTRHYTLYVCDSRILTKMCLTLRSANASTESSWPTAVSPWMMLRRVRVITVEPVMQGVVVRKAREMHAVRKRKPLMGDERHSHGAGEIDLGEIS